MSTIGLAALFAALALGFVEGFGRFYPSKRTWTRLRSRHGRRAVRAMRERFESAAQAKTGRNVATLLLALAIVWVAVAPALDKRWYEVVLDVLPYVFVLIAMMRVPRVLWKVAERMKEYERSIGEDPDTELDDGGATAIAL
ncbi:MAG: hypothetical protein GEU78_14940 [Actinobacteria bacterium]|nr:hypothetical protein [Actinomycetota bacterium]